MPQVLTLRAEGSGDELASFAQWLRDEPDIHRHARIEWAAATPADGEMGGALDVVKLIVESGFQLANLGLAYAAWRATRPAATPQITVERDGVSITMTEHDPEAVARLVRALGE
ncbi:effector-associated constant component EACC1 [Streptomyces sp. NPDC004126]|uniref:effector-associated constant component EACC1 n=1 Tax=Streptomyces sp. NPDC004126 TaxID=3390695 RepID=UPI003D072A8C